MKKNDLTYEDVSKIFEYNPLSGVLTNKRTKREVKDSDCDTRLAYVFMYNGTKYKVTIHDLCWMLHYQSWPNKLICHRDFNKSNCKITNLMLVSVHENYQLLSAYNNLTKYCDVKVHHKYQDIYLVRYLSGGRLKYDKYEDYGFAKVGAERLKNNYRRLIIKMGCIPPN